MDNKETTKNALINIDICINNAEWKIGQYEQKIEDLKIYIEKLQRMKEGIR